MNFIEAIKLLLDGKKIRLNHWYRTKYLQRHADSSYVVLNQLNEQYTIKLDHMLLDCWEIYEEQPKLHTFEEALEALKAGKKISRDYKYADVHKIGWENKFIFKEDDLFANDWIILED